MFRARRKRYYIVIASMGSIADSGSTIPSIRGQGVHGIIHARCETVSDECLAYLQSKEIFCIFCGKETFDPVIMKEETYALFGIMEPMQTGQ